MSGCICVFVSFFDLTTFDNLVRLMLNKLPITPTPETPPNRSQIVATFHNHFDFGGPSWEARKGVHTFLLWEVCVAGRDRRGLLRENGDRREKVVPQVVLSSLRLWEKEHDG